MLLLFCSKICHHTLIWYSHLTPRLIVQFVKLINILNINHSVQEYICMFLGRGTLNKQNAKSSVIYPEWKIYGNPGAYLQILISIQHSWAQSVNLYRLTLSGWGRPQTCRERRFEWGERARDSCTSRECCQSS